MVICGPGRDDMGVPSFGAFTAVPDTSGQLESRTRLAWTEICEDMDEISVLRHPVWVGLFLSPRAGCRAALSRPRLETGKQARDYHETTVACPRVKVREQLPKRRFWPSLARPRKVPVANSRAKPSKVPAYCIYSSAAFRQFSPLAWKRA